MIPRHGGLVPEMKQSSSAGDSPHHQGQQQQQQLPPPTLKRYTIFLPDQLQREGESGEARQWHEGSVSKAKPASEEAKTDTDTRLYSFIASADCPTPPRRLYATMMDDLNRAAELYVNADHGYDLDDDTVHGKAGAGKKEGRRLRRIPMKNGEPCRLTYTTVVANSQSEVEEEGVGGEHTGKPNWRLSSVALPEYEHLTCVILAAVPELPGEPKAATTSSPPSPPLGGDGVGRTGQPEISTPVLAKALAQPVMELRVERVSVSDGEGGDAASRRGISASWLSVPTVRFNKDDWKSMDALDKAAAAAASTDGRGNDDDEAVERRWTDDGGGTETVADREDARARKRARTKEGTLSTTTMSAKDIQAALTQNRQLLQQKRQAEEAAAAAELARVGGGGGGGGYFSPASTAPSYGYRTGSSVVAPPSSSVFPVEEEEEEPVVGEARAAAPPSAHAEASPQQARPSPSPSPLSSSPSLTPSSSTDTPAKDGPVGRVESEQQPLETLSSCGAAVIHELQSREQRQYASLRELEKLILRRLPVYEAVAAKMHNPARKGEAVSWFRQMQKELKLWLIHHGCAIDPTGIVTFPAQRN